MLNKKVILGIVIFVFLSLAIYVFAEADNYFTEDPGNGSVNEVSNEEDTPFEEESSEDVSNSNEDPIEESTENNNTSNTSNTSNTKPTPIKEYTITFKSNGGSFVAAKTVSSGSKVVQPTDPKMTGYIFAGWKLGSKNGPAYNFNNSVTANITLYATWIVIPPQTYVVTFDSNKGSYVPSKSVASGSKVSKPANPTRENFEFIRWELNGSNYNFNSTVSKNITLIAVWKAIPPVTPPVDNSAKAKLKALVQTNGTTPGLYSVTNDDNFDYVYRGETENNYIKFNGLTFRILGITKSGDIKVISDDILTNIPNSNVSGWLTGYFKSHIYTGTSLIKSYSLIGTSEYDSTILNGNTFLSNEEAFWTKDGNNYYDHGSKNSTDSTAFLGIKPVLTLNGTVTLTGSGNESSPYVLSGSTKTVSANSKLNTRLVGEYVRLDSRLYRIVEVTTLGTKIVLANTTNVSAHGSVNTIEDIEEMPFTDFLISSTTNQNILVESPTFLYTKGVPSLIDYGNFPTSGTKIGKFYSNVGLLHYGEMFTGYSGIAYKILAENSGSLLCVNNSLTSNSCSSSSIKPAMIILPNITYSSGSGTLGSPFVIQ